MKHFMKISFIFALVILWSGPSFAGIFDDDPILNVKSKKTRRLQPQSFKKKSTVTSENLKKGDYLKTADEDVHLIRPDNLFNLKKINGFWEKEEPEIEEIQGHCRHNCPDDGPCKFFISTSGEPFGGCDIANVEACGGGTASCTQCSTHGECNLETGETVQVVDSASGCTCSGGSGPSGGGTGSAAETQTSTGR